MRKKTKLILKHTGATFTFILLIIIYYSFFINNCFSQWVTQFEPGHPIRDIEFINRYTGWACGDARIYKTTNGGKNWIMQSNPAQSIIQQIHPINENFVYAAGWWTFLKTTNGGDNWISIFTGGPGSGLPVLEGLYFLNENTGWMCGTVVVMKTTDGGISFIDSMRVEADVHDIYFRNEMEGVMCGEGASVYKTTNGGSNWNRRYVPTTISLYNFIRITFVNDQYGWVGGNAIYKTTDFGSTWDSIGSANYGINEGAYCIEFSSMNVGYTGGTSSLMFKTTNGGYNWYREEISNLNTGFIRDIYAYNDSILWSGTGLKIIHTTTGGQVFVKQVSNEIPDGYKLCQNYPNPFNSGTIITYELRRSVSVELNVYNILGEKTTTLVNEKQCAGGYEVSWDGSDYPSGVYFYKLTADKFSEVKKMVLAK